VMRDRIDHRLDLPACDAWRPLHKVINRGAVTQVFKERCDRYARATKDPSAADFAGLPFHFWTSVPRNLSACFTGGRGIGAKLCWEAQATS